jgi:hypothetical protein
LLAWAAREDFEKGAGLDLGVGLDLVGFTFWARFLASLIELRTGVGLMGQKGWAQKEISIFVMIFLIFKLMLSNFFINPVSSFSIWLSHFTRMMILFMLIFLLFSSLPR